MIRVAIWGAAEWGKFVADRITIFFPKAIGIEYIVDKNYEEFKGKKIEGKEVESPEILKNSEIDYVIICSRRYVEIAEALINDFGFHNILYVEILWPERDSLYPQIKWERLKFIPYGNCNTLNIIDEISREDGELNRIGIKQETDKASIVVEEEGSFRIGHNYLKYYERSVERIKEPRICEFGCFRGSSLRTWKERFGNAFIVGVDIDESAKLLEEDRIEVVIGNATDYTTVELLEFKYGKFNVICDDASHAWGDIRTTFQMMWRLLDHGGVYILEDLCCGAQGSFPQYPPKVWDAQSIFEFLLDRTRILEYGLDWNPEANRHHFNFLPPQIQEIEREIATMTYLNGACIVEKR